MTETARPPADPGATPTAARALAPDLARGGMLLLIALANVHLFLWGHPVGARGYPADVAGADRGVALVQTMVVDGRAYPLFALLFGYGIGQLTRRYRASGAEEVAVRRLVRRRGGWMVLIGSVHAALLWSGDIVGVYGLLAVLLAGVLVGARDAALVRLAVAGIVLGGLLGLLTGLPPAPGVDAFLPSMQIAEPGVAALFRLGEWLVAGLIFTSMSTFGLVALGVRAARRRILDDPERHRVLLRRVAVGGIGAGVLAGLPMGLLSGQIVPEPGTGLVLLAGVLHTVGGYAAGVGYAAAFGLLAIRLAHRPAGPVGGAVLACGRRSLSSYLAQSLVFVPLLPAWALGLGEVLALWQASLLAVATWACVLVLAALTERAGYRGPAEVLLRRLTYGRRRSEART